VDAGRVPRRAEDPDSGTVRNYLKFIYPNLWENYVSKGSRVVALFAPIDAHGTEMYVSFHLKLPASDRWTGYSPDWRCPSTNIVLH
jgi:hypothetical protein